jgi:hypothetical protein
VQYRHFVFFVVFVVLVATSPSTWNCSAGALGMIGIWDSFFFGASAPHILGFKLHLLSSHSHSHRLRLSDA